MITCEGMRPYLIQNEIERSGELKLMGDFNFLAQPFHYGSGCPTQQSVLLSLK